MYGQYLDIDITTNTEFALDITFSYVSNPCHFLMWNGRCLEDKKYVPHCIMEIKKKKKKDEQQQYSVIATWTGCTCLKINQLVSLTGSHRNRTYGGMRFPERECIYVKHTHRYIHTVHMHIHTGTQPYIYTHIHSAHAHFGHLVKVKKILLPSYKPSFHQTKYIDRQSKGKWEEKKTECWNELDAGHDTCSLQV